MKVIDKLKELNRDNKENNEINSNENDNTRIISIASGKGGVGKTNLAVNLALIIQDYGLNTLLLDADFGMANVDVLLGMASKYNLSHIMKGKCRFEEAIMKGPADLHILPGTSGVDSLLNMSSVAIKRLLETSDYIEEMYDIVIIDIGAGINNDVVNFIKAADDTVIVLTPEPTSIMDAYSLLKILQQKGYRKEVNLLINQINSRAEGERVLEKINYAIQEYLELPVKTIGYIPYDDKVRRAVKKQKAVVLHYPHCRASSALRDTADILLERKRKNKSRGMKGFVYKIAGLFSGKS